MRYLIENHKNKKITIPADLPSTATATEKLVYDAKVKEIVKKEIKQEEDTEKLYSVVWGQCTPALKDKLKALKEYLELTTIELQKEIKKLCYNFQEKHYAPASINAMLDKFINCKQAEDMSDQRYLDKFNDAVRAITTTEVVMNVSELIIKQEHGDVSTKSVD